MIFPWTVGCLRDHKWHSRLASTTTFPHVSLFTKGDDSAKTVPVGCCFSRTCFMPFHSIASSSFDRISPGSKHFVGSRCWPNCVSQCCVRRFSLTVPTHLDSSSTFHKADSFQDLYPHNLFLDSKCWNLPRPVHSMWNRCPRRKGCCSL